MYINEKELFATLLRIWVEERCDKELEIENCENDNLTLKKEVEVDRLFYWILNALLCRIDGSIPVRHHAMITIKSKLCGNDIILEALENENVSEYLPYYVQGKDFLEVVKDTLKIFDNLQRYSILSSVITENSCEFTVWF